MAKHGRQPLVLLGVLLLTSLFIAPEASPWGSAVHAYIDDHLGANRPVRNANEMYGGMAPDVFNYLFDHPDQLQFLYAQTHNNFMGLWEVAHRRLGRSVAFGFVSHNDVWGADSTAHHKCTRCGTGKGYVIVKAELLLLLAPLPNLGIEIPGAVALELYHNIVESAVDLLIKQQDQAIGYKVTAAALLRSPEFPRLLQEAYGDAFSSEFGLPREDSNKVIAEAEMNFRKMLITYGQVLAQDDETAFQLVAEQLANQAASFLVSYGLPPVQPEMAILIIKPLLSGAMELCRPDYSREINATIQAVDRVLHHYGISY
jgi:hypothetical protein